MTPEAHAALLAKRLSNLATFCNGSAPLEAGAVCWEYWPTDVEQWCERCVFQHAATLLAASISPASSAEKQVAEAYGYLSRVFLAHAPQCHLQPDLIGLCTQIDNLTVGLADGSYKSAEALLAASSAEKAEP